MNIWYNASVPVSLPNDKIHTHIQNMVVWSQKLVNCDSTFSLDKHQRPFHLISLFHSVTLSASHSFLPSTLNLFFFFYPISLSQSLFVSQTPFLLVHTFLPHLLSISPPVHFLSPALNSFILSILASFLILPIWFSLFAGTTPLSHLPPFLPIFIPLCFCPPPCLDLLCAHHCSVIQPSISLFLPLLILCWVSLIF